jgi:hypothetical protein
MDLRATTESMRRSVDHAQSSIEQYRHVRADERLHNIADCLSQLTKEAAIVTQSAADANTHIVALLTEQQSS